MHSTSFVSPDFSSAEAQRLWYLKQLGIDSCVPRYILPAALLSQPCELPAIQEPAPAERTVVPGHGTRAVPSTSPRKPLFEDDAPARKVPAAVEPRNIADSGSVRSVAPAARAEALVDPATRLQFRMVLLRAERGLVVCGQVPLQNREGLNRQETRLLQNILQWLGSALLPERQRFFAWPPPGMEDHAQAADGELAGSSLFGFLEQAQRESRFTRLLLLGSSGPLALQDHVNTGATALPWQQFHSHSLGEMLVHPELKREAWQVMLPLHTLLQAG